jgi:hypothetical protein
MEEALSPATSDGGSLMDASGSPFGIDTAASTPNTDLSPPDSPLKAAAVILNKRLNAKRKLATLTQDEKASRQP